MVSDTDILKAMEVEKNKKLAGAVKHPQLSQQLTAEDIIKSHMEQANPGRGGQKIGIDSKMGAPQTAINIEQTVDVANMFNIPGLEKMIKNDRHN